MTSAKIHVTKLAAADRQLRSAIRLYFAAEDELTIHTVASAAYQLLKDLKTKRGMNEAEDLTLTSIFYVVRDYHRGTLPKEMTSDPEFMGYVSSLAEKLPIGKDTKVENISITLPPKAIGKFWNEQNKIANFLKHADRDSRSSIPLEEVDNLMLLMQCYSAYIDLTHDDLGNEGFILKLFVGAFKTDQSAQVRLSADLLKKLSDTSEVERRSLCSFFITELNKSLK